MHLWVSPRRLPGWARCAWLPDGSCGTGQVTRAPATSVGAAAQAIDTAPQRADTVEVRHRAAAALRRAAQSSLGLDDAELTDAGSTLDVASASPEDPLPPT
jgi:hypothetical protein